MADDPLAQLLAFLSTVQKYTTHLTPYLDLARRAVDYLKAADLMTIALLLVILYLSTMLVGMATRWVYGLVMMMVRFAMLLAIVVGGLWCWQIGVEEAVSRVMDAGKGARGWAEGLEGVFAGRGWGAGPGQGKGW